MIRSLRAWFTRQGELDRGLFFSVFRFPVRVHHSFWFVAVFLSFRGRMSLSDLVASVAVIFVSVLVHELGHARVAFRWAIVERITIHGLGGETRWQSLTELAWHQRLRIILAGPLAGFALALIAYGLGLVTSPRGIGRVLVRDMVWVNLAWGIFNLLPILPLDGGRATQEVLGRFLGRNSEWYAAILGLLAAGAAFVLAVGVGSGWMAATLVVFGAWNFRTLKAHYDANRKTAWNAVSERDQERERY